jgi:phosphate transport system substrate-binding protein
MIRRKGMSRTTTYAVIGVVVVILILVVAGFSLGWFKGSGNTATGTCPANQTLNGAGASLVTPIIDSWEFNYEHSSGNSIVYTASGAGAGVTALSGRTVDFAATDEPLNTTVTAALSSPVLTLPIVGGSVAIIYNLPGLTQPLNLSGEVVSNIYLGHISSWNDAAIQAINPGVNLPADPISTVHRLDSAGTTYVLTDYLSQANPNWKNQPGPGTGLQISWPSTPTPAKAISGNSKLAAYVNTTKYSIGYVDLADAHAATGVGIAAMLNPSGKYIVPTAANTESAIATISANTTFPTSAGNWNSVDFTNAAGAKDYPLSTLAYGFVYQAMDKGYAPTLAKSQALRQWFSYMITTGQSEASGLYYAPLPHAILTVDQAGLQTLTYSGNAIPACT